MFGDTTDPKVLELILNHIEKENHDKRRYNMTMAKITLGAQIELAKVQAQSKQLPPPSNPKLLEHKPESSVAEPPNHYVTEASKLADSVASLDAKCKELQEKYPDHIREDIKNIFNNVKTQLMNAKEDSDARQVRKHSRWDADMD